MPGGQPTNNRRARTLDTETRLGFEAKLWQAADALRNNMDAAEYKHVVLGLIFLKYISDAFEAKHAELAKQKAEGADPEDPDEYRAASVFWVPKEARWAHLKASAPQPTIGRLVDDAMGGHRARQPVAQGLFRVLHLLAHLLDQDLHVDRAAGGLEVLGLRGQGVGFAVELLHEEVEPAASGLARADDAAHLADVAREALELPVHVQAPRQRRQPLLQPPRADARGQLRKPLLQAHPQPRLHLRQPR